MWLFRKLLGYESEQDFVQYGIALMIIGLGIGIAAVAAASDVSTVWSSASSAIRIVVG
jgi:hypothetical protein